MSATRFAIQWYDPYMPNQPFKDGPPKGRFISREQAERVAENSINTSGAFDIPYEIVEVKP